MTCIFACDRPDGRKSFVAAARHWAWNVSTSRFCGYWSNTFDWKSQLDRVATINHYRYPTKEGYIHFI
jgi:hypothetical protein